ncbi:uncharacterized protein LOC128234791 [Mya arenaria]|uniref:uncharacterized protein LOC128234791 n=1 Tax=Mya arenaria TaxID=6604 RepID=UPI0022E97D03|nr:uncharacterized protein LOC128234791 [Mya arenaria]XP_052805269.1 uncharacterized protein LOC128234791 [Mya arenaria]XP_052805270.1 uncharacterized protein LOC128234791 [Mya arenaria]
MWPIVKRTLFQAAYLPSICVCHGERHFSALLSKRTLEQLRCRSNALGQSLVLQMHSHVESSKIEEEGKTNRIATLTDTIITKAASKDIMVKSLSKSQIYMAIKELHLFGIPEESLLSFCAHINVLKNLPDVKKIFDLLNSFGVAKSEISSMCVNFPRLLEMSHSHVARQLECLQSLGFKADGIGEILKNQPQALEKDLGTCFVRIDELKQLFKKDDVYTLLEKSPQLMFFDFEHIQDRFNYVYREMSITQRQMTYSKLFDHPMDHIHARHMFVVRSGFFQKIKHKKGQINNNPRLDSLLDTSDVAFAKKFGGMTELDYQTFKKLLLRENFILKELENDLDEDVED